MRKGNTLFKITSKEINLLYISLRVRRMSFDCHDRPSVQSWQFKKEFE